MISIRSIFLFDEWCVACCSGYSRQSQYMRGVEEQVERCVVVAAASRPPLSPSRRAEMPREPVPMKRDAATPRFRVAARR